MTIHFRYRWVLSVAVVFPILVSSLCYSRSCVDSLTSPMFHCQCHSVNSRSVNSNAPKQFILDTTSRRAHQVSGCFPVAVGVGCKGARCMCPYPRILDRQNSCQPSPRGPAGRTDFQANESIHGPSLPGCRRDTPMDQVQNKGQWRLVEAYVRRPSIFFFLSRVGGWITAAAGRVHSAGGHRWPRGVLRVSRRGLAT
ncbi:hypothetical protein C8R47DRAFT_1100185, partial [Mycena vitilis]